MPNLLTHEEAIELSELYQAMGDNGTESLTLAQEERYCYLNDKANGIEG